MKYVHPWYCLSPPLTASQYELWVELIGDDRVGQLPQEQLEGRRKDSVVPSLVVHADSRGVCVQGLLQTVQGVQGRGHSVQTLR